MLVAAPQPTTLASAPPTTPCRRLVESGWTVDSCGSATVAGVPRAWVVERRGTDLNVRFRVLIAHFSQGKGVWLLDLHNPGNRELYFTGADVRQLTGTTPRWVVGFRNQGTGDILDYDIVGGLDSTPSVEAHREVYKASVDLTSDGGLVEYQAEYPHDEPNCCPAYWSVTHVRYVDGRWRAATTGHVKNPPRSDL